VCIGNPDEEYIYPADTSRLMVFKYVYNDKKQLVGIYRRFNNDDYYIYKMFFYEDNRLSGIQTYGLKGKKDRYLTEYQYNESPRTKVEYLLNDKGKTKQVEYTYGDEGRIVKGYFRKLNEYYTFFWDLRGKNEFIECVFSYRTDGMISEVNIMDRGKSIGIIRYRYY
jgi:hypothetical protein